MRKRSFNAKCVAVFVPFALTLLSTGLGLTPAIADEPVNFSREVLPILSDKCFLCHGPDAQDSDLVRLDSFEGATVDLGGHFAIDTQSPADSEMLFRINSNDDPMPPSDFDKQLTADEKKILSRWIKQGGKYTKHWAFVPPVRSKQNDHTKNTSQAIDHFITKQLADNQVKFATEADRSTLARRVAFVLTGLPPEPNQLKKYLNDKSDAAYPKLVDELLASPRFGEHQARYWLDAVRYGDTHGLHLDNRRGIYPYRDWVVRAHNENLPLDRFITWQLAGDLLPSPTLEQKIATGFIRLNPSTSEGGAIAAEFQVKNSFDRTENFGTVFLGMSLNCARCHTHKYDPIPHTEYYRLLAFFNSTSEGAMDGNSYTYGNHIKVPGDQNGWSQWKDFVAGRSQLLDNAVGEIQELNIEESFIQKWRSANAEAQLKQLADPNGPLSNLKSHVIAKAVQKGIDYLQKDNFTTTLIASELPKPRTTHVLERGEYDIPIGDALQPGTFKVMGGFPADAPANRLGLAQWLTSRQHPLTSRVMVNQIWQRVFGIGLVRTPEDFGLQGQQPTHPELLDWLAVELQESDWNLKQMIRGMVLSKTFRQSSAWRDEVDDPENKLFARGPSYRLDAEVLRDVGLWASNLLDPTMGGEGVKPYQPAGMWKAMSHPASNTKNYERDSGQRLYRRSLYVYWKRTSPHPMMTLFDAPSRESSCLRRLPTNTSLQSLALLNETQRVEMARTLAERLMSEAKKDEERLDLIFGLVACRKPHETEQAACKGLLKKMRERFKNDQTSVDQLLGIGDKQRKKKINAKELAAWTQVCSTILASDAAILLY